MRRESNFRINDIFRAVKGARKSGLEPERVVIDYRAGTISVVAVVNNKSGEAFPGGDRGRRRRVNQR